MGLDMYLYLRRSCHYTNIGATIMGVPAELQGMVSVMTPGVPLENIRVPSTIEQRYRIGYWRKAYPIHNFFVDKLGGDEERCLDYVEVEIEDLEELRDICYDILHEDRTEHNAASDFLPDDSDEYGTAYYQMIQYTYGLLVQLIPYYHQCNEEDRRENEKITEEVRKAETTGSRYTGILYSASW